MLSILNEFEDSFDVSLVEWDTYPVELELNSESKLVNSKYYLARRINKENLQKELQRIVETSVNSCAAVSTKYTIIIFLTKEGTVRFIKDYRDLNKKQFRKLYPLPRIGETIHQLEGFQYATVLDLSMG